MTREEAISEWTFRSNYIKKWLDEYGEEPSIRHYVELIDMAIEALSEPSGDLISRADAIEVLTQVVFDEPPYLDSESLCREFAEDKINALPSADVDGEDLIIKGAKGVQDGLYNIKDGKLFEYKANGGTVRTYPIVPSADAVSRKDTVTLNSPISIQAEMVSVVRCKDCKQRRVEGDCTHYYYCDFLGSICGDNEYCSFGERREP